MIGYKKLAYHQYYFRTSKLGKNEVESFMCLKSVEEDEVISGVIMTEGKCIEASFSR